MFSSTTGTDRKPNLLILTPAYDGTITCAYLHSFIRTRDICASNGVNVGVAFLEKESLVQRARNTLVARFLALEEFTHMLFIDADITWEPEDVLKMLKANKEVICGAYPKKDLRFEKMNDLIAKMGLQNKPELTHSDVSNLRSCLPNYALNFEHRDDGTIQGDQNKPDLIKVYHASTGFMMIARSVFDKLREHRPDKKYKDDHRVLTKKEEECLYAFFDCGIVNGSYLSEDYYFCVLCQNLDIDIYVDISVKLSHIGLHKYQGDFKTALEVQGRQSSGQIAKSKK
jgi:hypothetical protein